MSPPLSYIVTTRERNMAVCDTLREVYDFLKDLKKKGITYANIIGADQSVRLTENGFWVWTTAEPPTCEPTSTRQTKSCST